MQKPFISIRLRSIRSHLKSKRFSEHSIKYICQSWKRSTSKQYDLIWNKRLIWCSKWKISAIHPSESEILNYLSDLALNGRSFSVINAHTSAICQTLAVCGNSSLCDNPALSHFMKGIFIAKPPKPKYTCTSDVSKVLTFLNTLWPLQNLSLKELTLKLVALLALSTAQRVQTLGCLKLNLLSDFGDYVVFTIDELTKTSKPGKTLQKVKIDKYTN